MEDINRIIQIAAVFSLFSSVSTHDQLLVDKLRMDFIQLEEKLWKFVLWEASGLTRKDSELYLVENFNEFDHSLKKLPEDILRGLEPIKRIQSFPFFYSELKNVEKMYQKFRKYQKDVMTVKNVSDFDKTPFRRAVELQDIVGDILSDENGANASAYNVYNMIFGEKKVGFEVFEAVADDFYCKSAHQSPQQVFYNLYNVIALNGVKGYVMLQFAYMAKRIEEKGNYTQLSLISKTNFERRVNETMSVLRGAMELAPTDVWMCDPKIHVKNETYDEFTRLLQGHIQNEVDMNPSKTCTRQCAAYTFDTDYGCYDADSKYCREMERCAGKIIGCRFVESHMNICLSKSPSRRYDYIEYESGRTFGTKTSCWRKPVSSWFRWFVHCSYCMCLCDEHGPKSDRFVSMRPAMADIARNRVVTGLKLVKRNRIVHAVVQEGKLLPYGYIDNSTVRWVPVDEYKITDPGIMNGEDYFTMTYHNRTLALDELRVKKDNYIVTGVRFQYVNSKLRFQIYASPFDWNSGSVSTTDGYYIFKETGGKNKIDLTNADIPTRSPSSKPHYNNDLYVEFTHTSFEKDAAQTTVPYIDTQPIFNYPPVPLSGAGIHYKGAKGYGGFVAPKIASYDFSDRLLVVFPRIGDRTKDPGKNRT